MKYFKIKGRKKLCSFLAIALCMALLIPFAACGTKPTEPETPDQTSDSSSLSADETTAANENDPAQNNSETVHANNTSDVPLNNPKPGDDSSSTSNSGIAAPTNPDKGGNNGGNSGNSNSKPQNPTNPITPPTNPTSPEVPVIKDSITRLPEAEKLAWAEINRRRVAGGVSAFNHCDSCEDTANKQAKFNAEYLKFDYMCNHAPSECGAVTWYASPNDSAAEVANWLVNGWWGSAGHKANLMDGNSKNGGIAIYKVVRNGVTGYMSIFHFDDTQFCCDTVDGLDYFETYCPEALYKH